MSEYISKIKEIFGEQNVSESKFEVTGNVKLWLISVKSKPNVTLLITDGLRNFHIHAPEKFEKYNFTELYFCLPNYWKIEHFDDLKYSWIYQWLEKMITYLSKGEKWIADGHTFSNESMMEGLSQSMKQKYLMLVDPIFMKPYFNDFSVDNNKVSFLAVLPIFEDEMDFKVAKGTFKLKRKLLSNNITEILDDFRMSIKKNKWRLNGSFFKR